MIDYLLLPPGSELPNISSLNPFRAVVILEKSVSSSWQEKVSDWLVSSGCLYMMAWGKNCSSWDDSVDHSNIKEWSFGAIPEDRFVMTTWHENESLRDVFWFSKHNAMHPVVNINNTLLLHVSTSGGEKNLVDEYNRT